MMAKTFKITNFFLHHKGIINLVLLNKYRVCFAPLAMTLNLNVIAREERPKQSKNPIPN